MAGSILSIISALLALAKFLAGRIERADIVTEVDNALLVAQGRRTQRASADRSDIESGRVPESDRDKYRRD